MHYDFDSYPQNAPEYIEQVAKLTMKSARIRVEFTRQSWKCFARLRLSAVPAFVRAIGVKADLALYIASHEERNLPLDTECQELCYQPGLHMILRKEHGVWYITEIIATDSAQGYAPVYFWTHIRRGLQLLTARMLIGWRRVKRSGGDDGTGV